MSLLKPRKTITVEKLFKDSQNRLIIELLKNFGWPTTLLYENLNQPKPKIDTKLYKILQSWPIIVNFLIFQGGPWPTLAIKGSATSARTMVVNLFWEFPYNFYVFWWWMYVILMNAIHKVCSYYIFLIFILFNLVNAFAILFFLNLSHTLVWVESLITPRLTQSHHFENESWK